jgi:NSS family neurotransmitter:Na+ symporter
MMSAEEVVPDKRKNTGGNGKRDQFVSKLGIIMATLGSAVGLGNIWKFPYQTGSNGGAVFIILYIISVLLIGIPVMVCELSLGRKAKANAVESLKKLSPNKFPWWLIGAFGILGSFFIMAFYTEVAGWVFSYIFKSVGGGLLSTDPKVTGSVFTSLITDPTASLIWQWVDIAIVTVIIVFGVSKGIEKVTKRLIPILLVLLIIVAVRSVTLPGAGQGLTFLLNPDFSKVTAGTILTAMGLAFFKLSIGMGVMMTYGSYFRDDQDIPGTALRVAGSDLVIALLAGVAIFPAVFAYGFEPNAGVSLLFNTIPAVFSSMPLGNVFMVVFFILTYIASIGAQISLMEAVVTYLEEQFKVSRLVVALITAVGMALVGSTAALSNSTLANFKVLGLAPFDFFDVVSSNYILPIGGFCLCIFVGWIWGEKNYMTAVTNNGTLKNTGFSRGLFYVTKFIAPVLVLVVLLNGLGVIKF